ncbi:phenylalanine--tRNA ligase subunit alpha [Candidatus Aerophobetes bacterium]|uniref:Phenylalanine--tRNA ligase alpha subunit n=1 Tax=Aerophobetes bacterium TaxID=2030807 RepID=A0A523QHL7_UNCAE|nr:MAG: phenylalanine--tRNA ligase subunit alpha [Candidatus Aerophobetes bacterium]
MKLDLKELSEEARRKIGQAKNERELDEVRIELLGRKKGKITLFLKGIKNLPPEDRPRMGELGNRLKKEIGERILEKKEHLGKEEPGEYIDVTLPGEKPPLGRLHPITQTLDEIKRIFIGLGFRVVRGPEIETEYYNFEALNMPQYHPARDEQDSFYLEDGRLLRTQTSPVQIRIMEKTSPPIRIIAPGRCYRRDAIDASHFPMFHQVEGLAVDRDIAFSDLKGSLTCFVYQMFGKRTKLRFRPSFFPFTEPSAEVDISCIICGGSGCTVCSGKGWLEILGAGMVDPEVFKKVNYDPEQYQGFAFGMGVERICMLKYGIDDIRLFFQNDLRFLRQF